MSADCMADEPRQAVAGWVLHKKPFAALIGVLVASAAVSTWQPGLNGGLRLALLILCAAILGLLSARVLPVWQRISPSSLEHDDGAQPLDGWHLHLGVVRILLLLLLSGIFGSAWVPASYEGVKVVLTCIAMFAAGLFTAKDVAMWQPVSPK